MLCAIVDAAAWGFIGRPFGDGASRSRHDHRCGSGRHRRGSSERFSESDDIDTGLVLEGSTNGSGFYVFSPLKIGNYTVSATANGFQTTVQENIHLDAEQRLNIGMTLKAVR